MFFDKDKSDAQVAQELEKKFWKELGSSPFIMLGLQGVEDSRTRPMTAQVDGEDGSRTIYFFADNREHLVQGMGQRHRAVAAFTSKGHDIFAHIHGELVIDNDREVIDRLWNPMIAAWFEDGKTDPNLVLLRFDTEQADIWEADAGATLKAAALSMLGKDPGDDFQDDNRTTVEID
ncbi:pyridoxamine 5'-phosphate oxidase family protein [Sphingomicrobium clamense]|uniref:Pyridoxamine 5'-phosphate oxidase family protein n=1 Tax=Sphingomicrobium clamense TaxID=2851013 RepID=A0ABS6V6D7_9SPHN|nr:pyridoxamine 5'-phosphate oxidase family protein [Sphingomicrobium sp. B8]MBW0145129.1 pyridoxamine 5'-phosphate oxidase family protein [Sphingomicrobium sp. B8]